MRKQLFPKAFLAHSVEVHQFKYSKRSRRIYWTVALFLLAVLVALPLIKVNVYATARGMIKPDQERLMLRANTSGQVVMSQFSPNITVAKGDTLLRLTQPILQEKQRLLILQMDEHQEFLNDLEQLLNIKKEPELKTPTYQKQWSVYLAMKNELLLKRNKLKHDWDRAQSLFNSAIIPKVEWEQVQHAYQLAQAAVQQYVQQTLARWENDARKYADEKQQLSSSWEQLNQQQQAAVVCAPADGTLLLREGIALNSWVQAGQVLGELSPAGKLIVEAYAPSHKIGQVNEQTAARFQIDAYNYRQWGMATGRVVDKGKDVEFIDNTPLFKVRCSLDQTHLQLTNGVEGKLQKGLGLTVLLYQNRRSLFDLLFDDVNDWMNPNQPQNTGL